MPRKLHAYVQVIFTYDRISRPNLPAVMCLIQLGQDRRCCDQIKEMGETCSVNGK
jgi:hypothetical protein